MADICMYCKTGIPAKSVLSVCRTCGIKVWGSKMYETIKSNMEESQERGDLEQGNVH